MWRSGTEVRDRRTARFVSGSTLVVLALAMSTFGLAPAAAQDTLDEEPQGSPVEITASHLYVSPVTDGAPNVLISTFPPAAVCVLQPDLCPERRDGYPDELPWREDVSSAINDGLDQGRDFPVQPVPPDSAAVSFLGGNTRYQTAILFDAPAVPEGEDVMRFELTFQQGSPTYDMSSPAFRRAVLAAFEAISAQDPVVFAEGLAAALQESPIDTSKALALEACPLLKRFEPAGAPQASDEADMPRHEFDGEEVAAVDCTFGGNGVYDEDADEWRVDLAFTAQAWADGELENHGVLLRPIGAPNLAFGDADTTTNAQLVLDLEDVTAVVETAEAFDPGDFGDFGDDDFAESEGDGFAGDEFDAGAPDLSDGGNGFAPSLESPEFPAGDEGDSFAADSPEVATGPEVAQEPEVGLDAQAARPAGSTPVTPWWVWLVAPLLLGGAYLTGSAVLAPAPVVGASGGGALTRMLDKRGLASTAPTQI
ncbi:hypothetical protein [Nitriliruptor alkaliphilus]|uniref:hypothetical protein n=1 Tax=Nitriliruptor alkaliphilus TaxID=427918 RepID=UPI00069840FB|nr:hypothetical protein [Nitriliruptor alkaliphilus]